jgi:hypothetical protein
MKLREIIQRLAGTWGKANFKTFDAIVTSVDIPTRTCVVDALDNSLFNLTVRFMVEVSDGDMEVPQEDSTVTVAMTDFTEPYIVSNTWLDNKLIIVGNQSIDVQKDKQIYNDGAYGGWATIKDPSSPNNGILARLNKIEDDNKELKSILNSIKTACAGMVVPSVGSPDPFAVVFSTQFATYPTNLLVKTVEEMISNPNITHGKKFGT